MRLPALFIVFLTLGGCSLAPDYAPPATPVAGAYREAGPWVVATPQDAAPRGDWWRRFEDPQLDDLEARLDRASPTLAAALARYDAARAQNAQANAALFPSITGTAQINENRLSATRPLGTASARYTDRSAGLSASYEADLWGRVRATASASKAEAQASKADLASVRLSLQARLADSYFALRADDAQIALLRQTVEAYRRAWELTDARHSGGISSGLDINRAETQLANARALLDQAWIQRSLAEHAIAALLGVPAPDFSLAPAADTTLRMPPIPTGTPSQLLQRRPDIAAAERRMAAANARIGVARAGFFPLLTLGAGGGFESTTASLARAPNGFWALGPAAAALPLFDAGANLARLRGAHANFAEASADYRATVLAGFADVEDNLARLHRLGDGTSDQRQAAEAARRTSDLALIRYRDGASDYLEVVTAQTAALDAEMTLITLRMQQLQANVDLIRALGGDFER